MRIPQTIKTLVEHFSIHYESYTSPSYNETQLRREFLDPFFEVLGWDVNNTQGIAEAYKDVIHEDAIKIGGFTKAPDYCFRIGGTRKFFVEAKKPAVNLKSDASPAFQLRRYAWSAKLPISILSDFEEFVVYDTRIKPRKNDAASKGRILYFKYTEYLEHWDEIQSLFSKEAILKGNFDKFTEQNRIKKGNEEVNSEFLKEIEQWREHLAKDIAQNNPTLSTRELNFSVQRIIDRIIFLRICEDRGIESRYILRALLGGERVYPRLCEFFSYADDRYNSGLFHFREEKEIAEAPDTLTQQLKVNDGVLKDIFKHLYYPDSPYEFSVLPADILGQVYEQFLGKIIRLTSSHHAVVEEKPEVKKAGGVYYTPTYIVDYIVKQTAGKLLESKNPVQAAKLKILDPACGSGSFLLGAYQCLLDWHRDWYVAQGPEKYVTGKSPILYQTRSGEWRLTSKEKKRILLNNIYGVDIDSQAVEVTKLSLSLKVLEGENEETITNQLRLFHERALPDLGTNIKCGNSLIGPDFYEHQQITLFDNDEQYRINVFDWKKEFPEIFKVGGFDVVIGNPPYRNLSLGKKQKSEEKELLDYYKQKLPAASSYKINLFGLFIERCITLLRLHGLFSFIIPNLFFTSHYFSELRNNSLKCGLFSTIVDLRYKVFSKAEIGGNGIFVFSKDKKHKQISVLEVDSEQNFYTPKLSKIDAEMVLTDPAANLLSSAGFNLITNKIKKTVTRELGQIATIYQGVITGDNSKFLSQKSGEGKWKKIIRGRDINRYALTFNNWYIFYDPEKLWSNANIKMYQVPEKLISRQTSDRLVATYDDKGYVSLDSTHVIHLKTPIFSLKYLLGLYNSRLLNFLYQKRVQESGRVFAQVKVVNIKSLPIRLINFSNKNDKERYDKVVKFVDQMLLLQQQLTAAKIDQEQTTIRRQLEAADNNIDRLIYELYGLTDEEIKIVEKI